MDDKLVNLKTGRKKAINNLKHFLSILGVTKYNNKMTLAITDRQEVNDEIENPNKWKLRQNKLDDWAIRFQEIGSGFCHVNYRLI